MRLSQHHPVRLRLPPLRRGEFSRSHAPAWERVCIHSRLHEAGQFPSVEGWRVAPGWLSAPQQCKTKYHRKAPQQCKTKYHRKAPQQCKTKYRRKAPQQYKTKYRRKAPNCSKVPNLHIAPGKLLAIKRTAIAFNNDFRHQHPVNTVLVHVHHFKFVVFPFHAFGFSRNVP